MWSLSMRTRAFTLVEILVVITIIAILMTSLLVGVSTVKRRAAEVHTATFLGDLMTSLFHISTSEAGLPQPDGGSFIEFDPAIDQTAIADLKDFANWPVMNKVLMSGTMESFERNRFAPGTGRRPITDAWSVPLRYVIGDSLDDQGYQPEGSREDWNWDPGTGQPLRGNHPYVYSYGPQGVGSDPSDWIIAGGH